MTRTIRMVLEYDGSGFYGFQRQPGQAVPTVQGELERLLGEILAEKISVVGAGRTDAGVHATGQVVSFTTTSTLSPEVMRRAVNGLSFAGLVVREAQVAEMGFNARHSASSRRYQYVVYNHPHKPGILRTHVWHVFRPLHLEPMQEAARGLVGSHDFRSFSSQASHLDRTRRTVLAFDIARLDPVAGGPAVLGLLQTGGCFVFNVEANAFLPHMVRMLVGTLVRIGSRELPIERVAALLQDARDGTAGPAAPPQGLCLVAVRY